MGFLFKKNLFKKFEYFGEFESIFHNIFWKYSFFFQFVANFPLGNSVELAWLAYYYISVA